VRLSLGGSPELIVKARTFDQEIPSVGESVGLTVLGSVVVFTPQAAPTDRTCLDKAPGPPTQEPKASTP
jgi:hypothetical protein